MKPITESEIALSEAKKSLLNKGYQFNQAIPINKGRYQILEGVGCSNVLLIFKRDWFLKYGEKFKYQGKTGMGETINKNHLKIALKRGCKIIARTNKEGVVLLANLYDFIESGTRWTNKEGFEVISNTTHLFKNYDDFDSAQNDFFRQENTLDNY